MTFRTTHLQCMYSIFLIEQNPILICVHVCRRSCYYDAERYLKLFKVYSEKNCVFECMTNYTLRECGCNSFHFPRINGTKTCSLDQLKCIEKALNIYQEESYFKRSGEDVCKCKPACTSLVFHSDIQHTPADSINYIYEALEINSTES